jgi:hypothetical protein
MARSQHRDGGGRRRGTASPATSWTPASTPAWPLSAEELRIERAAARARVELAWWLYDLGAICCPPTSQ